MLDFTSLNKAISSLSESISVIDSYTQKKHEVNTPEYRTFRAGVIQYFEFTYELAWKAMRTWLAENQGKTLVDGITRKELFRFAAENGLIDEVDDWFMFHFLRNQTSHTYEEKTAMDVYQCTPLFLIRAQALMNVLNKKND